MITAALLAATLAVAAGPVIPADPFTDDATYSWEDAQGIRVLDGIPVASMPHNSIPVAAVQSGSLPQVPNPETAMVCPVEAAISGQWEPNRLLFGCFPGLECPIPLPEQITDRTSVFEQRIGLVVDGLEEWEFPAFPAETKMMQVFAHLRSDMQTVQQAFLQIGMLVRIQHVHLREHHFGGDLAGLNAAEDELCATWPTLSMARPVAQVARLSSYAAGGKGGESCPDNMFHLYTPYSFASDDFDVNRNAMLRTVTHEFGHNLLRMSHTMDYYTPDGEPLDSCGGPEGPLICKPSEAMAVMSYCTWYCGGPPWPLIRFGRVNSMPWLIARNNVIVLAAIRGLPTVAHVQIDGFDLDGDELPELPAPGLDTCPGVPSNSRTDRDMDALGDACDACHIGPGNGRGWWLALAVPLLWRRGRRRATDQAQVVRRRARAAAVVIAVLLCAGTSEASNAICTGDGNGDGHVTIDELVSAVGNALNGACFDPFCLEFPAATLDGVEWQCAALVCDIHSDEDVIAAVRALVEAGDRRCYEVAS